MLERSNETGSRLAEVGATFLGAPLKFAAEES